MSLEIKDFWDIENTEGIVNAMGYEK